MEGEKLKEHMQQAVAKEATRELEALLATGDHTIGGASVSEKIAEQARRELAEDKAIEDVEKVTNMKPEEVERELASLEQGTEGGEGGDGGEPPSAIIYGHSGAGQQTGQADTHPAVAQEAEPEQAAQEQGGQQKQEQQEQRNPQETEEGLKVDVPAGENQPGEVEAVKEGEDEEKGEGSKKNQAGEGEEGGKEEKEEVERMEVAAQVQPEAAKAEGSTGEEEAGREKQGGLEGKAKEEEKGEGATIEEKKELPPSPPPEAADKVAGAKEERHEGGVKRRREEGEEGEGEEETGEGGEGKEQPEAEGSGEVAGEGKVAPTPAQRKVATKGGGKRAKRAEAGAKASDAYLEAIQAIPTGQTRTYTEVAQAAGRPSGARSVGKAVRGLDHSSTPIPWYRVVGADGRLQYDGGPKADMQLQKLREEGARPLEGEGVSDWAKRVGAHVVGAYVFAAERFIFTDLEDSRINDFHAERVERFGSVEEAEGRGFVRLSTMELDQ